MTTHEHRSSSDSDRGRNHAGRPFGPADNGKQVVTPAGDIIGSIVRVRGGDAYMAPSPGLLEGCGSWLTGTWNDCAEFQLNPAYVAEVRADRIVLCDATTHSVSGSLVSQK